MDIYEYLKLDHKHVAYLFKQFEKSQLLERKKQIVFIIAKDLMAHAYSENETFYRALKEFELTEDDAAHGEHEHKEIENQIAAVLNTSNFGESWLKKVEKLKELVEHHVKDEEGAMFTQAKSVLSQDAAYDLKEQMHYIKQNLLLSLEQETQKALGNKDKTTKKSSKKKIVPVLKKSSTVISRHH